MAQSAAPAERDFASTVRDIRADNGPLTWGLFEVSSLFSFGISNKPNFA